MPVREREVAGNDHDRKGGTRKGFKITIFTVHPLALQKINEKKLQKSMKKNGLKQIIRNSKSYG